MTKKSSCEIFVRIFELHRRVIQLVRGEGKVEREGGAEFKLIRGKGEGCG